MLANVEQLSGENLVQLPSSADIVNYEKWRTFLFGTGDVLCTSTYLVITAKREEIFSRQRRLSNEIIDLVWSMKKKSCKVLKLKTC